MAQQPLFATISDNYGRSVQSLSREGYVDELRLWVNSLFGEVCWVTARYFSGKDFVTKPDLRRVPVKDRARVKKEYEEAAKKKDKVQLNIQVNQEVPVRFSCSGVDFDLVTACRDFLKDDVIVGKDIDTSFVLGILPEYEAMISEDKNKDEALDAFVKRKNELIKLYARNK